MIMKLSINDALRPSGILVLLKVLSRYVYIMSFVIIGRFELQLADVWMLESTNQDVLDHVKSFRL